MGAVPPWAKVRIRMSALQIMDFRSWAAHQEWLRAISERGGRRKGRAGIVGSEHTALRGRAGLACLNPRASARALRRGQASIQAVEMHCLRLPADQLHEISTGTSLQAGSLNSMWKYFPRCSIMEEGLISC